MNDLPVIAILVLGFLGVIFSVLNRNSRFNDLKESMNQRLDDIISRLERIESKFDNHETRITRLEEPLIRR